MALVDWRLSWHSNSSRLRPQLSILPSCFERDRDENIAPGLLGNFPKVPQPEEMRRSLLFSLLYQGRLPQPRPPLLSTAAFCCAAHLDIHQHASRHAGVRQWSVSTPLPNQILEPAFCTQPWRGRNNCYHHPMKPRPQGLKELAQGLTATNYGSQDLVGLVLEPGFTFTTLLA